MGLDLRSLLERKLPDLNCARVWHLTLLSDAAEKNLARMMDNEVRNVMLQFRQLSDRVGAIVVDLPWDRLQLVGLRVDGLIATNGNEVVILAWQVHN